jgi:hypothetical protein
MRLFILCLCLLLITTVLPQTIVTNGTTLAWNGPEVNAECVAGYKLYCTNDISTNIISLSLTNWNLVPNIYTYTNVYPDMENWTGTNWADTNTWTYLTNVGYITNVFSPTFDFYYTFTNLNCGDTNYYYVTATNISGLESERSNVVTNTIPVNSEMPVALSMSPTVFNLISPTALQFTGTSRGVTNPPSLRGAIVSIQYGGYTNLTNNGIRMTYYIPPTNYPSPVTDNIVFLMADTNENQQSLLLSITVPLVPFAPPDGLKITAVKNID